LIKKLDTRIFDEDFFPAYSEDVWLGYESRKNGYKSIVTPEVIIYHLEGMSTKNEVLSPYERQELNNAKLNNREKLFNKIESIEETSSKKYKVAFIGTVRGGWSYAHVLRNLSKALNRTKKVDVAVYDPDYHQFYAEPDYELSKMLSKKKDFTNRISIRYSEASTMFLSFGKKKIGYTTHESVTTVPKDWVYQLNQLDQVWTTTEFVKKIFINSGVKKPIFVIPHGVDFNVFNPNIKPAKLSNTKGFIFYCNNIYGPRKNIDYIIKAYVDEFTCEDNVTLLLKCNFNDMLKPNKPLDYFAQFERKDGKTPKIELIEGWTSPEVLAKFYRKADCFIGIANEGFGLTNFESMACGVPCIAPSWGGLTDFCNKDNSLILERAMVVPARQDFLFKQYCGTHWCVPDIFEIREKMRYAYENQEEMKEKGKKSFETVSKMTWENAANKCIEALENL
jgi:glycosyltransferase involved in cell wall biosynthesis